MSVPHTTKAWTVEGTEGFDKLKFHEALPVQQPGDHEVLVKSMMHSPLLSQPTMAAHYKQQQQQQQQHPSPRAHF